MTKEVNVADILDADVMTNHLTSVYTVTFAGRPSACRSWIERHGIGEIYPDYDGGFQVRVYL